MAQIGVEIGLYHVRAAALGCDGRSYLLRSKDGRESEDGCALPAFIRFATDGCVRDIGEAARRAVAEDPASVVWGAMQLVGRGYDQTAEVRRRFAYPIERGPDGGVVIRQGPRTYRPEQILALLLEDVRRSAEDAALNPRRRGEAYDTVVLAHPAYFDSAQLAAMHQAALGAGFAKVVLVTEPEAALLAYNEARGGGEVDAANILTINWGAGTLDFVLSQRQEDGSLVNVGTSGGSTHLGGLEMDDALVAACTKTFGLDAALAAEPDARSELRSLVESMKIRLSKRRGDISDLRTEQGSVSIRMARTRSDVPPGEEADWVVLEEVLGEQPLSDDAADPTPILEQFRRQLRFVHTSSGFTPDQIDELVLIGGPMYMPCVRRVIGEEHAGNAKVQAELAKIDADGFPLSLTEAVARGAALYTGRRLPLWMPPFAYGPVLGLPAGQRYGEVLIQRGAGQPQTGITPALGCQLPPGGALQTGLFRVECRPEGERYSRFGQCEWTPKTDSRGRAVFRVQLDLDAEGGLAITLYDDVAGTQGCLRALNRLASVEIPAPAAYAGPIEVLKVDAERAAAQRGEAERLLRASALTGQCGDRSRSALDDLRRALAATPEGPASEAAYAHFGLLVTAANEALDDDPELPDAVRQLLRGEPGPLLLLLGQGRYAAAGIPTDSVPAAARAVNCLRQMLGDTAQRPLMSAQQWLGPHRELYALAGQVRDEALRLSTEARGRLENQFGPEFVAELIRQAGGDRDLATAVWQQLSTEVSDGRKADSWPAASELLTRLGQPGGQGNRSLDEQIEHLAQQLPGVEPTAYQWYTGRATISLRRSPCPVCGATDKSCAHHREVNVHIPLRAQPGWVLRLAVPDDPPAWFRLAGQRPARLRMPVTARLAAAPWADMDLDLAGMVAHAEPAAALLVAEAKWPRGPSPPCEVSRPAPDTGSSPPAARAAAGGKSRAGNRISRLSADLRRHLRLKKGLRPYCAQERVASLLCPARSADSDSPSQHPPSRRPSPSPQASRPLPQDSHLTRPQTERRACFTSLVVSPICSRRLLANEPTLADQTRPPRNSTTTTTIGIIAASLLADCGPVSASISRPSTSLPKVAQRKMSMLRSSSRRHSRIWSAGRPGNSSGLSRV